MKPQVNAQVNRSLNKDTLMMSALLVMGMLMTCLAPIMSGGDATTTQLVADSANGIAQSETVPTAMRPALMQPAIIVTAPRIAPATNVAKSRRLHGVVAA